MTPDPALAAAIIALRASVEGTEAAGLPVAPATLARLARLETRHAARTRACTRAALAEIETERKDVRHG